ncbi:GTPase HflX [bacterium]|nr:GTPase HflX [bacterium]
MNKVHQLSEKKERAILVGVTHSKIESWLTDDRLSELRQLAETAGAEVVEVVHQRRAVIDPAYYIGKGKCGELKQLAGELNADLIIFDDDLSPAQARNLEGQIERRIIDRSGLILDIFANRARTKEAKLAVEMAQLNYMLPRLTGHWEHLSRQVGGIGVRGPGETQLETDRRLVRKRIGRLKEELERIERGRETRRKRRSEMPMAALVGYTNSGKSTLLNALTRSKVFVENRLFATLDPAVRRFQDEKGRKLLFTDTVGFIRKLPHHLIASFRSTLEEVMKADLLLHIVDLSHPHYLDQMEQVRGVLRQLDAIDIPCLVVFNKVDLVRRESALIQARQCYNRAVFISALRGIGLEDLKDAVFRMLEQPQIQGEVIIEIDSAAEWEEQFIDLTVESKDFIENEIRIRFRGDGSRRKELEDFPGNLSLQFVD